MRIFIVPLGLFIVLILFSVLLGWNLLTLFLFWFLLTPALSLYLPGKVSGGGNYLAESFSGLFIFYGLMVFAIYEHYRTDYFEVMMISAVVNVVLVLAISLFRRPKVSAQ